MPHLLLVDDNADHLFLTRRALRTAGIDATGVQTAETALEALRSQPYDMILLDHNLPGMTGSELIAQIRDLGLETPVVMVTGGGSEQLAVDALKSGALDYIVKSDGYLSALAPRVQRALSQHQLEMDNRKLEQERRLAEARVNEHARRLRALQQASLRINSSLKPRDVRTQAVNHAASLVDTEMAAFFLLQEDGLSLHIVASCGLSVSFADTLRVPVGEGAMGRAVLRGEPVAVTDVLADERTTPFRDFAAREGYRSVLAVPLLMRGDAQGGIVALDRSVREWEPEEIALLQTLAQNVAVAYENAQLYDRLASRVAELQTLNRIVTVLTTSTELEQALEMVVEESCQLLDAAGGAIVLKEAVNGEFRVHGVQAHRIAGVEDPEDLLRNELNDLHKPAPGSLLASQAWLPPDLLCIKSRKLQFTHDLSSDPRMQNFRAAADLFGFRSMSSVPLVPQDEAIGALQLFYRRRRRLDRQERQLLETVANSAAVAVQRALLQDDLLRQKAEQLALLETSRLKTEFISTVSHELRTPLASISGYIKLIQGGHCGPVPEIQKEFLDTIARNSVRLCSLVDDLLDISRIESGSLLLSKEPIEIASVVQDSVELISQQAEAHQMPIEVEIQPDLPWVMADFQRVGEVITNFLSNAIKYGKDGTPVVVRAWLHPRSNGRNGGTVSPSENALEEGIDVSQGMPSRRSIVVSVQDQGIGIAESDIPKLFRKFFRVDNSSTRKVGGTGLGLAISKHLVELHGGNIWVESEMGRGSTFYFSLPASQGG